MCMARAGGLSAVQIGLHLHLAYRISPVAHLDTVCPAGELGAANGKAAVRATITSIRSSLMMLPPNKFCR